MIARTFVKEAIQKMTNCPTTAETWKLAEQRKNCTTGIYHCLKTELNYTKEVCAPGKTLIQAGSCPYWNFYGGNVDRIDCSKYSQCPNTHFLSNEVYLYPFCYQRWSTTTSTTISTTASETSAATSVSSSTSAPESSGPAAPWFLVLMAVLSCVVVVALLVVIIRYLLNSRKKLTDPETSRKGPDLNRTAEIPLLDPETPSKGPDLNRTAEIPLLGSETPRRDPDLTADIPLPDGHETNRSNSNQNWNDSSSFFVIDAFRESIEILKNEDILVIKGYPGSGKTVMAMEILDRYENENWSCIWIDGLENIDSYDISENTMIVMDHCFGNWNNNPKECVHERLAQALRSMLEDIYKYHNCKMVLIITTEESNLYWTQLYKDLPKIQRAAVIDMDCERSFPRKQKKSLSEILTSNITRDGCKRNAQKLDKYFSRLIAEDGIGFPLKVKLLCEIPNITIKSFCCDVMESLKKHFNGMRTASEDMEKLKYAMLSYIMLKGRLSHDFSFDTQLGQRLNESLNEQCLKSHLDELKPYVKKTKSNCFEFEHEILYIALFKEFYEAEEDTLLRYCNIDAVQEICRPPSSGPASLSVVIERESFKVLANRIREEGLENDFKDHILLMNEEYKQLFHTME